MTNGRPPDDGSSQPLRKRRDRVANAGGLAALGKQLEGSSAAGGSETSGSPGVSGRVANESGLRDLGARIDAAGGRGGRGGGRGPGGGGGGGVGPGRRGAGRSGR